MSKKLNLKVNVNPSYNPETVIVQRTFGIKDLKRYQEKIKKNIKVFEEAIVKERIELKRIHGMIDSLKADIVEAKQYKRQSKK